MSNIRLLLTILSLFISLLLLRLFLCLPAISPRVPPRRHRGTPTRLLIVLGSGGHTAEMLSLLRNLNPGSYTHRSYVVSSGDDFSAQKAVEFEQGLEARVRDITRYATTDDMKSTPQGSPSHYGTYDIAFVPRARQIHQSLLTTPFSALRCLMACSVILHGPASLPAPYLPLLPPKLGPPTRSYPPRRRSHSPSPSTVSRLPRHTYPDLIVTNGPATATILILASLILRFFSLPSFPFIPAAQDPVEPASIAIPASRKMRTIYVESWARVRRMSLSGRILVWGGICERVMVQWEGLAREGVIHGLGRREFRGVLIQ
ncbi:UDP-N-acetylglucosamine transferase subunit [Ptychographa xylographoides]|nr:UDP-N-acetylglucosamine transferase subunit [Ptychographa xylographoides]